MTDIWQNMSISAAGMRAQGERTRVIVENLANADTTALTKGGKPYQRQIISFKNEMDRQQGLRLVKVDKVKPDMVSPFDQKYMPDHPAADDAGYVKMPNVNTFMEMMDMREAQRSYEANLGMIEQSRDMMQKTINLLQ
ncbi:MAG: flagellar basal body rod protein FlgC [Pseudomonadota bacterium]